MSHFNTRKINILNIIEITKKVLFSLLLVVFSLFGFFNLTYATNDVCPNLAGTQATIPNGYVQIGANCFLDTPATPDNGTGAPPVTTPDDNTVLGDNLNVNTLQDNGSTGVSTETTYTPLAPLPGLEGAYDTTGSCPLGKYMNIMIGLILGIAAVLAMVMIVSGGIQYMTSELVSSKEAGKDQIKNAILGLLLALGAYLILNTINPTLLKICLNEIPKATIVVSDYIGDEATTLNGSNNVSYTAYDVYTPNNSCPGQTGNESATCVPLSTSGLSTSHPNQSLEATTLQRLLAFDDLVSIPWYITEGWPPTSGHQSSCHQNGTCLDLNISNPTAQSVKIMINGLLAAGMCPHYEVMAGGLTAQQLISAGVPSTYIWNGHGTGPHFHVINGQC